MAVQTQPFTTGLKKGHLYAAYFLLVANRSGLSKYINDSVNDGSIPLPAPAANFADRAKAGITALWGAEHKADVDNLDVNSLNDGFGKLTTDQGLITEVLHLTDYTGQTPCPPSSGGNLIAGKLAATLTAAVN